MAALAASSGVSTVFLGMNHGDGVHAPVLWEATVLGGFFDKFRVRCAGSWVQAEAMDVHWTYFIRRHDITQAIWYATKSRKQRHHALEQLRRKYGSLKRYGGGENRR